MKNFWVIEHLGLDGNLISYLKEFNEDQQTFFFTDDINKSLHFDSELYAHKYMNTKGFLYRAGGETDRLKIRQHVYMTEDPCCSKDGYNIGKDRDVISLQLISRLEKLATRAEIIANLSEKKLQCIRLEHPACTDTDTPPPIQFPWPELFDSMRSKANRIENALNSIEDDLNEIEI